MAESWNTFEAEYLGHIEAIRKPRLLDRIRGSARTPRSRYDEARVSVIDRSRARWATGAEFRSALLLMMEYQSFLTTVLAEAAKTRGGNMDDRDLLIWSLGRLANSILHSIRHAFLDTVFPSVASGIRSLLEVIATIEYIKTSDENLSAYLRSEDDGVPPLRIRFMRLLGIIDRRDNLNLLELYQHYSELTHPKLSIVKTALVSLPDSPAFYVAIDDEWTPEVLRQHWRVVQLCVDQLAVRVMGHFGLDPVLLKRLEQMANDPDPFRDIIE